MIIVALLLLAALHVWAGGGSEMKKLKGMEIVIGQYWTGYDTNTYEPRSEADEKTLEYRKKIQKDYGFRIYEKEVATWERMPSLSATSIMAGKPIANVLVLQPNWAMTLMARGLLYPVSDSKAVNFNSDSPVVWNKKVNEAFTFGGKQYAFYTNVGGSYGGSMHAQVVFFNKRLFREAGLSPDLPYDMQKDGTWTWDNYLEICRKLTRDTNNDGIMDTYAITMDLSTEILDAIVASNGANYIDKDANGNFVNATGRPEYLEALQFGIRLKNEGVMMPRPSEDSNWDWYQPMFNDGKVAMRIEPQYLVDQLANMKDDWGMVLFPKGPRAKDYAVFTDENVMVIPATYKPDEVDRILVGVQAWSVAQNEDWRAGMYNNYRDSRAVDETVAMIRDPKYHVWKNHIHIAGLERGDIAWQMWWHEGDPAELIEAVSQSWNALIADANNTGK